MTKGLRQGLMSAAGLPAGRLLPERATLPRPSAAVPAVPISKQVFDRAAAVFGLLFFAPFLIGVSLAIWLTEGGPVLFGHERIGRGGRRFRCLKFRTMAVNADQLLADLLARDPAARAEWEAQRKLAHDPRVSRIGALLRRTSLDELPQFWNVLRGDMSMVGPRPVVADELTHYGAHLAEYLAVQPGITGIWQVSGRNNTSYEERVAMDVDYVRNRSFLGDLRIVVKTAVVVLKRDGAR
jgi:exopolysaccharide production protein ExoY